MIGLLKLLKYSFIILFGLCIFVKIIVILLEFVFVKNKDSKMFYTYFRKIQHIFTICTLIILLILGYILIS